VLIFLHAPWGIGEAVWKKKPTSSKIKKKKHAIEREKCS